MDKKDIDKIEYILNHGPYNKINGNGKTEIFALVALGVMFIIMGIVGAIGLYLDNPQNVGGAAIVCIVPVSAGILIMTLGRAGIGKMAEFEKFVERCKEDAVLVYADVSYDGISKMAKVSFIWDGNKRTFHKSMKTNGPYTTFGSSPKFVLYTGKNVPVYYSPKYKEVMFFEKTMQKYK